MHQSFNYPHLDSNLELCHAIANRIITSAQKRITFAEYMDLVLYDPDHGYYTNAVKIGFKDSDFFTSVNLTDDFGELLAIQFLQMWEILDKPSIFHLVEMGAGQGILAQQILHYIQKNYPDFFQSLHYIIIEKSPKLQQQQKQRLQNFAVNWYQWSDIADKAIIGCFFSNELVDAFPVHQFIIKDGQLQEIYVTITEEGENNVIPQFTEEIAEPSTTKLKEYLELVGIDVNQFDSNAYENDYRSEINLAALQWLSIVADCLKSGYVLTIDYGYPAHRYYHPRRWQGTLQCYYQHRHHHNPYINIGKQDITAHVDFTALENWGKNCGLDTIGYTQQGLFLMALGLGERLAHLSHTSQPIAQPISQILQRRQALHQLIDPTGLGNFGVLIQSQGLTETQRLQPLQGLKIPE